MGTLTLSDLKDELKRGLGNRSDTDTRLTRFLNIAQSRIARLHDFEEMQQNATGMFVLTANPAVDKILVLGSLREIHSFRIVKQELSGKLKGVSTRMWDQVVPQPDYFARDTPTHYTKWASQLEIWPVPDVAYPYQIRWTKWPTAFDDNSLTATSDFIEKDDLIIALAEAYAFDSLSKNADADRKYKVASTLFSEALSMDSKNPDLEYAPAREIFGDSIARKDYWTDPFQPREP